MTPDNTARIIALCGEMAGWAKKQGMQHTAAHLEKIVEKQGERA